MQPIFMTLSSAGELFQNICNKLNADHVSVISHEFPDGETYLKVNENLQDRACIIYKQCGSHRHKSRLSLVTSSAGFIFILLHLLDCQ